MAAVLRLLADQRRHGGRGVLTACRRLAPAIYVLLVAAAIAGRLHLAVPYDAHAYFHAASSPATMYEHDAVGTLDAYLYSPAFAQALAPLAALGWSIFATVWAVLLAATLWWLAREWSLLLILIPTVFPWAAANPFVGPVSDEWLNGNIDFLLAAALVLSFRWPATWALSLLTKATLGVCLLWYVVRGEWRHLATALAATTLISLVSLAIAPSLWMHWATMLAENATRPTPLQSPLNEIPLVPRLLVAAIVVAWGAAGDRRWTLPIAALLAMPAIWYASPSILVGIIALQRSAPAARPVDWTRARFRRPNVRLSRESIASAAAGHTAEGR